MPLLTEPLRRRIALADARVDSALDRWRGNRFADRIFYGASALGDHSLIWLMLGGLRGLRSEHQLTAAARVAAVLGAESTFVNIGVKSLFKRARPPWETARPLPLRRPKTSSFPSGHATSAFTAAGMLSKDDPWWPLYYATAAVVATSRVYVRIHHASDVVGGIPIGILIGRVARRFAPLPPPTPLR